MHSAHIYQKDFDKYPLLSPLLHIHDTPKELYFKAKTEDILNSFLNKKIKRGGFNTDFKVLTIVGSRKYSVYGKECVEYLTRELSSYPVIIVSGLALGIDTLSHINALNNNLPTIAVPGSGLGEDKLYPAANVHLARDMLEKENIMISEWSDDTKSELYFFPKRNRVMAAISDAVLIIEAGEKSGTLITARLAMEYGKNVGVVPNNIFAEGSVGSNELIKSGATPVTSVTDILEMLNFKKSGEQESLFDNLNINNKEGKREKDSKENIFTLNLSSNEKIIFDLIKQNGNLEKEVLLKKLEEEYEFTYTDFVVALMQLEIKGLIKEEMGEVRIKR